jgi:hypothetical protein
MNRARPSKAPEYSTLKADRSAESSTQATEMNIKVTEVGLFGFTEIHGNFPGALEKLEDGPKDIFHPQTCPP